MSSRRSCTVATFITSLSLMACSDSVSIPLFESVNEAGPVIIPQASAGMRAASNNPWEGRPELHKIYGLIREYDDAIHSGVIDSSNMYKVIFDANFYLDRALTDCEPIEETAVASPFDFGAQALAQTYDCAFLGTEGGGYVDHVVAKQVGDVTEVLMGNRWDDGEPGALTGVGRGVTQARLDMASAEVVVNAVSHWDNNDGEASLRIHIDGNMETGLFTLNLMEARGGGVSASLAGYGYSKGSHHYLFRWEMEEEPGTVTIRYYCFESETTDEEMQQMDAAGSPSVPPECADYEAHLPDNYSLLSFADDLPTSAVDFTGGGEWGIELTY